MSDLVSEAMVEEDEDEVSRREAREKALHDVETRDDDFDLGSPIAGSSDGGASCPDEPETLKL